MLLYDNALKLYTLFQIWNHLFSILAYIYVYASSKLYLPWKRKDR